MTTKTTAEYNKKKARAKKSFKREKEKPLDLSLAKTLTEPLKDPAKIITLIYGEKKIGKTSLASEWGKEKLTDKSRVVFMMFEPGGRGLSIYQNTPSNWDEFKVYVDLLKKDTFFSTAVIDTVDIAYSYCLDYVCRKNRMSYPADKPYGEGWKLVRDEFSKTINQLLACKGVLLLSHAKLQDVTTHSGRTYAKIMPTMGGQASEYIVGLAELIGFYGYYGRQRFLTIRGSDEIEAGHRLKYNFWTAGKKKERVHSIPMGESEEEAYQNFLKAFRNEQKETGEPEKKAVITAAKPTMKGRK